MSRSFRRRADESALGPVLVEGIILLSASRNNASQILRDAAEAHRVDTDAIALKVKQEFAAKDKTKRSASPHRNQPPKPKNAA